MTSRTMTVGLGSLALALALVAAGCSKKGPSADEAGLDGGIGSSEFDTGSGVGAAGEYGEPEKVSELASVYFDYDSFEVRSDARATLKANAGAIRNHDEWRSVVVEGHTDERGSEEYNLALGERRAQAVQRQMVLLGASATQIRTMSYGEERPRDPGHDEAAYGQNRRVEVAY